MFLSLANVIRPHGESIHLQYLIDCIRASKGLFDRETRKRFEGFSGEVEMAFKTIAPTVDRVVQLRDKSIAHLDRDHVNNPGFMLQNPDLSWQDVETAYTVVDSALTEIRRYLALQDPIHEYIGLAYGELQRETLQVFNLLHP